MNVSNLWQMRTQSDNRYLVYKEIGEWLNVNTSPEDNIGMLETGIIGYYSRRSIVDFAGLIQPEVAQRLTPDATYEDAAIWAVENYNLNYLVLHEDLYPKLGADYIEQNCILVKKFYGEQYHYPRNIEILVVMINLSCHLGLKLEKGHLSVLVINTNHLRRAYWKSSSVA